MDELIERAHSVLDAYLAFIGERPILLVVPEHEYLALGGSLVTRDAPIERNGCLFYCSKKIEHGPA